MLIQTWRFVSLLLVALLTGFQLVALSLLIVSVLVEAREKTSRRA